MSLIFFLHRLAGWIFQNTQQNTACKNLNLTMTKNKQTTKTKGERMKNYILNKWNVRAVASLISGK